MLRANERNATVVLRGEIPAERLAQFIVKELLGRDRPGEDEEDSAIRVVVVLVMNRLEGGDIDAALRDSEPAPLEDVVVCPASAVVRPCPLLGDEKLEHQRDRVRSDDWQGSEVAVRPGDREYVTGRREIGRAHV